MACQVFIKGKAPNISNTAVDRRAVLAWKKKKKKERSCAVELHTVRVLTKTVQLSEPTVLRCTGDFIVTSVGEFLV